MPRPLRRQHMHALAPAILLFCSLALRTQEPPSPPKQDPFTQGQEKAMQALGVTAYAPFPWADHLRTEDIDRVLGDGRILWLETAHFRIGTTLKAIDIPEEPQARKDVLDECVRLAKKCSKLSKRPKKLEPWHRAHLYAQRAEEMYADLAKLVGAVDGKLPSGPFLGLPDKYLLLLFEKKSDLARYSDRFCGREVQASTRHFHTKTQQVVVLTAAEHDPPHDEAALHHQVNYLLCSALIDGLGGHNGNCPQWLSIGLAQWYARQVTTPMILVGMKDSDRVDQEAQHKWREKMYARAQHETLLVPFAELATSHDFGYYETLQAWSRVDFLLKTDSKAFGALLLACKRSGTQQNQLKALLDGFNLEPDAFDQKWRAWVLANYK